MKRQQTDLLILKTDYMKSDSAFFTVIFLFVWPYQTFAYRNGTNFDFSLFFPWYVAVLLYTVGVIAAPFIMNVALGARFLLIICLAVSFLVWLIPVEPFDILVLIMAAWILSLFDSVIKRVRTL